MEAVAVRNRKLVYFLCIAVLVIFAMAALASGIPQTANPPLGTWIGTMDDGMAVTLLVNEEGGYRLDGPPDAAVSGTWTWAPSSDVAGVLTGTPVTWPARPITEYTVTWLANDRIEVSTAHVKVVLQRMI
jgi:hypothetical protein